VGFISLANIVLYLSSRINLLLTTNLIYLISSPRSIMTAPQIDDMKGRIVSLQEKHKDRLDVLLEYNDKFFNVILSAQIPAGLDGSGSIARQYLQRLSDCVWDGDPADFPPELDDKYMTIVEEIEDLVRSLCQPLFKELAAEEQCRTTDLHTYMNPDIFQFRLVALNGDRTLISYPDAAPLRFHPAVPDSTPINTSLPRFSSSSIEVLDKLGRDWVLKVSTHGQVMCCKITSEAIHQSMCQELKALQQVFEARLNPPPRVSCLKGIVEAEDGDIVGILTDYVEAAFPSLADALSGPVIIEPSRKVKWITQIEDTLKQLHSLGVIWGDAKTANILIDMNDDVWIIDFGGGQTMGWVDHELVGTVEGDMQALTKIKDALQV
jgi:tRNA A-37 threonylcarbamoyl transferase component Bud32